MSIDVERLAGDCAILLAPPDATTRAATGGDVIPPGILTTLSEAAAYCAAHGRCEPLPALRRDPDMRRYALGSDYHLHVDRLADAEPREAAGLAATLFARAACGNLRHPDGGWQMTAADLARAVPSLVRGAWGFSARTPWSPAICHGVSSERLERWSTNAPPTVVLGFAFGGPGMIMSILATRGADLEGDPCVVSSMRWASMLGDVDDGDDRNDA